MSTPTATRVATSNVLVGHYNPGLVALSIAIAIIASYTALDLANRVTEHAANPRKAWRWLAAGSAAMGSGIWSMHFIGMLAFSLPIPLAYNWPITALSWFIAVGVSALALFILRSARVAPLTLATGATLMGAGISAMHYTGMMAMQMFPPIHYDARLFVASVLIAVSASLAALGIAITLRRTGPRYAILAKVGSAAVMGCAIAGMHYTGMEAAAFAPGSVCLAITSRGLSGDLLAAIVSCMAMAIMGSTLILSAVDRHFARSNEMLAGSLQIAKDAAEAALRENQAITLELRAAQGQLLSAARKAGMAEIATNVLHNVGNVLNSVSVSAGLISTRIRDSKSGGVLQAIDLMHQHAADLGDFIKTDPRGQRLLPYLMQVQPVIAAERTELLAETAALLRSVEHIKEIVATQQSYAGTAVVAEPVDATELLEDALRMHGDSLLRHGIDCQRDFCAVPQVLLDKHLVLQILVNLIHNASQAMREQPDRAHRLVLALTFESGQDPPRLRIRVEDNGEGIAPEHLPRLFTHGFTTRKQGHGFGLHSSALAARALGGTLSAHSDGSGRGATFTLDLPVRLAVEQAA